MKLALALCALSSLALAAPPAPAPLPAIPDKPIAAKKELLFSDDFESPTHDKKWHDVVPKFTFENGTLKGTQVRLQTIPAQNGKPEIKAHQAVYGLDVPTKDSIIETKIRFDGATRMTVEYDDRNYTGSHYGHIATVQVSLKDVAVVDQRDGVMSNAVHDNTDPAKKPEIAKLVASHKATFPTKLEQGKWYNLVVELAGEAIRVLIDGKAVAYFKSSGIGHATKSKLEFGVTGADGRYDDLKVYNAEPAK